MLRPTAPRKTSMISASTEIESVAVLDSSVRWRRQGYENAAAGAGMFAVCRNVISRLISYATNSSKAYVIV